MENSSSVLPILFYPSFSSAYDPLPFPCTHTPLIPNLICPKHPSKFEDLCTKSRCQMKTRQKNVTSTLWISNVGPKLCWAITLLCRGQCFGALRDPFIRHVTASHAWWGGPAGLRNVAFAMAVWVLNEALDPPGAGDILLPWPSSVPDDFHYSTCLHTQPLSCALGLCIGIK